MREYHTTEHVVTGAGGKERRVFCAYASPSEIRLHLENGWRAYAAEAVKPETWVAGSTPIPRKGAIQEKQVDWLIEKHMPEVRVVFIPDELNSRKDELFEDATGAGQKKSADTKLHRASPQYARERVAFLVRCCTSLVKHLQKIPLGTNHEIRDPIVIQQLTEAREAVPELYAVMLEVAKNLLNGDGNKLAELLDIEIDDQSAHVIFQYGVLEMLVLHFLGMGTENRLVHAFFAAIFMNMGLLADEATEENHAAYSAYIYRAVCAKKPELPEAVADLILDHGNIWLSNTVMRFSQDTGSGGIASERRMYAELPEAPMVQSATFIGAGGASGSMELLDNKQVTFALTLTVVEQIVDRSMQGERAADILSELAARLTKNGYDLIGGGEEHQCVFASVLAAASNAHKVKPRGAVVAFGQQGKVPNGRPIAVSLGHPEQASAPYCLVLIREGAHLALSQATSMRELLDHELRSLRSPRQVLLGLGTENQHSVWLTGGNTVVGFVDAKTYDARCSETEARLESIVPLLEQST